MRSVLVLALLVVLAPAAPALAAFSGSNGQVAFIDEGGGLYVDDPFDDGPAAGPLAQTSDGGESGMAPPSPPQWSPDGTRLLFTAPVDNGEIPVKHSAVFVIDRDGTDLRQVTHPFPGKRNSCDVCDDGEAAWDVSPVWRDDDTIAFIRWVAAGDDATHEAEEGSTVYRADVGGGGETLLRRYHNEDKHGAVGVVWPQDWGTPVVIHVGSGGYTLRRVDSDTVLAGAAGITDVDASADGERLAYRAIGPGGFTVVTISKTGQVLDSYDPGLLAPSWVRFAPDDNGLILPGCAADDDGAQHCGLITHRLPDPDADVRPGEPADAPYLDMNVADIRDPEGLQQRSMFDVQSQDLPVMYIPGFLGSEIECDGDKVWMPNLPPLRFEAMRLQADGVTNATCPSAKPTGRMVDDFLFFADVYGHGDEWLEDMDPPGGYRSYGWDWRKSPQESLAELDGIITELLKQELLEAQGTKRVSMVGHSYGALLMRTYIDDPQRSRRVGRVLTVGAPYWGVPKPIFSIAFGTELPSFSAIDLFASNEDMALFARNMAGIYHLFPSDSYGPWLRYEGDQLDQDGVAAFVKNVAKGNEALLRLAWTHHRDNIDGFLDYDGRIDYRSVTGVGALTIAGVDVTDLAAEGDGVDLKVRYEDGDGTVTARSATQGPRGTLDPLGDDVNIQYRCGFLHMDQTKDEVLQAAYGDFLVTGRIPRRLPAADCAPSGREFEFFGDLEVIPPAAPQRAEPGEPLTLGEAEVAGAVDVVRLPGRTVLVRDDARTEDVTFEADGLSFAVTELDGTERGPEGVVGPVSGTVVLGGDGSITVDGTPVTPVFVTPTPTPTASPAPTVSPTPTVTPTPTATPAPDRGCAAKVERAKRKLAKARRAQRRRPSASNRKKVKRARKALRRAKRCGQ